MTISQLKKIIEPLPDDAEVLIGDVSDEEAIHYTSNAQIGYVDGVPSDFEVSYDSNKPFNAVTIWPF